MAPTPTLTRLAPRYVPEAAPPIRLPEGRTLGAVTGVQVGPDGHIWVLHIAANMEWGPASASKDPADRLPPVVEFATDGHFVQAWGGPDWLPRVDGRAQWPRQEETIAFDDEGTIWVFGANTGYDHAVQRFTRDGRLLLRIGRFGETGGEDSRDLLGCPTDVWHDVARREAYVTDGYVNHRVAVFDSDTGAFKRAFGAYGHVPQPGGDPAESFANPVHAVSRGPQGHLYICDRINSRLQVFDVSGECERFVHELELRVDCPFGSTFNLAFTPDERFMLINDGSNSRIWSVDLTTWEFVGDFMVDDASEHDLSQTVHKIASDRAGNLILGRTARGVERLRFEGIA